MKKLFTYSNFERILLIQYLNDCRTAFLEQNKPIEDVSDMLFRVLKAHSGLFANKGVYTIKMKDYDYRVLIVALNSVRLNNQTIGADTTKINKLLLKVIDAYGV